MTPQLLRIEEPKLLFGHRQSVEDPRDGLTLFGPLDAGKPFGIRAGVIGTRDGLRRFKNWVKQIQVPSTGKLSSPARPVYPGFEAAFGIPWVPEPATEIEIPGDELYQAIHLDDQHLRVYKTVDLYASRIVDSLKKDDVAVDVWFIVIPDDVYKYGRPMSMVESDKRIKAVNRLSSSYAKKLLTQASLFVEDHVAAKPYHYEVHFHNQLKARLLEYNAPTQIVRESTIAYREIVDSLGNPTRDLEQQESAIAWSLSTTTFYKAGGRPWKLAAVRQGVCYIGLAFKQDQKAKDPRSACCAAQMFLDSGDGVVFKGAVGPWFKPGRGDFHLSKSAARELVEKAISSYTERVGQPPSELFLHGKVRFNDEEWSGFRESAGRDTNLVGIRIRGDSLLKLFRQSEYPVLRGLAYVRDPRTAYLWTKGFVPRLQTYPGREVPLPLMVEVCRGETEIEVVLKDIMALTKLNYNACIYADGPPVTLKFADAVGEILTAGPLGIVPPLAFRYYI
ncbi:MAG: hypothetical protein LLF82_000119 [Dehalococcoides mccartyi]|uniref:hypothetical protein n=1 Tax=Dehalococcoides mccartyi TaxID=61435 RepID=UPI002430F21E|nr:hypothetical protein [Dehalococcoides mccartyi]MCF7634655.1 hypothetical protein [Dehalococcoides mccartyi]